MFCPAPPHPFLQGSPTNFETQPYYTNALHKCNTIILLNKALLQGMHPQFMQLLNLKHCFITTNALYKCNTIVLLNKALLQSMHPSQQGPSAGHASTAYAAAKFEHHRTTTNALYKCNTLVHLNKALLQSMHPSQQGPSAGHASTAYVSAKFETPSYYNKCTVQVQYRKAKPFPQVPCVLPTFS
jgi:hypothetical protein